MKRQADLAYIVGMHTEELLKAGTCSTIIVGKPRQRRWTRPPKNVLKLNGDGAFQKSTGEGAWGYAIRYERHNGRGDYIRCRKIGVGALSRCSPC